MKHHGIAYGTENSDGLEFYTCFTLFDISNTGVIMAYKNDIEPFVDSANQAVANKDQWDRSLNQQRNWDIIVQAISMRAQPMVLQKPKKEQVPLDLYKFGSMYSGVANVWIFRFAVEAKDVFKRGDDPIAVLSEDCRLTPLITGLTETFTIIPECIDATNTYFEYGYSN